MWREEAAEDDRQLRDREGGPDAAAHAAPKRQGFVWRVGALEEAFRAEARRVGITPGIEMHEGPSGPDGGAGRQTIAAQGHRLA
jgi:hypothetical protein